MDGSSVFSVAFALTSLRRIVFSQVFKWSKVTSGESSGLPSLSAVSTVLGPREVPSKRVRGSKYGRIPRNSPPGLTSYSVVTSTALASPAKILVAFPFASSSVRGPTSAIIAVSPSGSFRVGTGDRSGKRALPFSSAMVVLSTSPS